MIHNPVHESEPDYGEGRRTCKEKRVLSYAVVSVLFVASGGWERRAANDATGGRGEIRTHEGAKPPAGFQDRCLKPLGHPSTLQINNLGN
jgi:hypothetical protein